VWRDRYSAGRSTARNRARRGGRVLAWLARVRSCAVLLVALAGCQGYRAGSFAGMTGPFAGERRTVGCLDVAVTALDDPAAVGPAVGFTIANRCDAAVAVDLGAVRATGRVPGGDVIALHAFDPALEIRPAVLEARSVAQENLEYRAPAGAEIAFTEWCVDVARLDARRPSDAPVLVCFAHGVLA
jgi:hypothetical protein